MKILTATPGSLDSELNLGKPVIIKTSSSGRSLLESRHKIVQRKEAPGVNYLTPIIHARTPCGVLPLPFPRAFFQSNTLGSKVTITSSQVTEPWAILFRLRSIMIPGARLATYFIANFSFHGWMKCPEAGRRPSKRKGRDKLNEWREGGSETPVHSRAETFR